MNHAEREIVEIVENEYLIHAGPDSFDEKEQFPWEEVRGGTAGGGYVGGGCDSAAKKIKLNN